MAAVVGIVSGHGLSIHVHGDNRVSYVGDKLVLYKPLFHCNSHLKQL